MNTICKRTKPIQLVQVHILTPIPTWIWLQSAWLFRCSMFNSLHFEIRAKVSTLVHHSLSLECLMTRKRVAWVDAWFGCCSMLSFLQVGADYSYKFSIKRKICNTTTKSNSSNIYMHLFIWRNEIFFIRHWAENISILSRFQWAP